MPLINFYLYRGIIYMSSVGLYLLSEVYLFKLNMHIRVSLLYLDESKYVLILPFRRFTVKHYVLKI